MADVFQCTAYYSGRVQGVGFRFKTTQVAREYEVSGTVRNLEDGRVFLEAEGAEAEVRAFLADLEHRMGHFIRQCEHAERHAEARYRGFSISH